MEDDIDINFKIRKCFFDINARAKKVGKKSYEIVILRGLLEEFRERSIKCLNSDEIGFNALNTVKEREISDKKEEFSRLIASFWLFYIFLHELQHILLGHLEIQRGNGEIQTFPDLRPRMVTPDENKKLEGQADFMASHMNAIYFFDYFYCRLMEGDFYGPKVSIDEITEDYVRIHFMLFKILDDLHNDSNIDHPDPILRSILFQNGLESFTRTNSLFSNIKVLNFVMKPYFELFQDNFIEADEELFEFLCLEYREFMKQVDEVVKDYRLKERHLFNDEFMPEVKYWLR